jgi:hypothetical protein
MSDDRQEHSVLGELTDELRLQAWLARREYQDPSLSDEEHAEASALARMRDEIRVQMHLGKLEAQDEFDRVEARWRALMKRDVEPAANTMAENLEAAAHDLLREIRDQYQKLLG